MLTDFEIITVDDSVFLMEQMELREALSEIKQAKAPDTMLKALKKEINERIKDLRDQFNELWQSLYNKDMKAAAVIVQKMSFLYKLMDEVDAEEERLFDYQV